MPEGLPPTAPLTRDGAASASVAELGQLLGGKVGKEIADANEDIELGDKVENADELIHNVRDQAAENASTTNPVDGYLKNLEDLYNNYSNALNSVVGVGADGLKYTAGAMGSGLAKIFHDAREAFNHSQPGGQGDPGNPGGGDGGGGGEGGGGGGGSGKGGAGFPGDTPPTSKDPLVIDLNGDGVSLTPLATSAASFDINNDGFAPKVSWLDSNDGFLVRDLNSNGKIDNESEMFGSTQLSGHDDLATFDGNHDGRIDSSDAVWSQLQIWRDANGNGITESGELHSLSEFNVTSLSLQTSQINQQTAGGQIITSSSVGSTDGVNRGLYSVNFQANEVLTTEALPDGFEMNGFALLLPSIAGFGRLESLQVAMTNDAALLSEVQDFVSTLPTMTATQAVASAKDILFDWAGVSDLDPTSRGAGFDAREVAVVEKITGQTYPSTLNNHNGFGPSVQSYFDNFFDGYLSRLVAQSWESDWVQKERTDPYALLTKEVLLNPTVLLSGGTVADGSTWVQDLSLNIADAGMALAPDSGFDSTTVSNLVVPLLDIMVKDQYGSIENGISQLTHSLADYVGVNTDAVGRGIAAIRGGNAVFGTEGNDVYTLGAADAYYAGGGGNDTISASAASAFLAGDDGNDQIYGNNGNDILVGGAGDDVIHESGGDDTYVWNLGDGNDVISGSGYWDGTNTLEFGSGIAASDLRYARTADGHGFVITINGQPGSITLDSELAAGPGEGIDQIAFADGTTLTREQLIAAALTAMGTSGNDTITMPNSVAAVVDAGAGNDIINGWNNNDRIIGGTGNDVIYESGGDDTYVWNLGDGNDKISGSGYWDGTNTLEFGPGIAASDLRYTSTADGHGFVITIDGQPGSITLDSELAAGPGEGLDQFTFADGTVLTHNQLMAAAMASMGTSGNDTITMPNSVASVVNAGAGNDTIYGWNNNDRIIGGPGDDVIYESPGDDTYVWNPGDGNDTISGSGGWDGNNTLEFGPGVTSDDLTAAFVGTGANDVQISFDSLAGSITLDGWRNSSDGVDKFTFSDGTIWTRSDIEALAAGGTENMSRYAYPEGISASDGVQSMGIQLAQSAAQQLAESISAFSPMAADTLSDGSSDTSRDMYLIVPRLQSNEVRSLSQ